MATRRKSIRPERHDRELLIKLYQKWRIPIDQFEGRPDDEAAFVVEWNNLARRTDSAADLMHYMKTQRKRGLWIKLGDDHEPAPPVTELSAEETEALVDIFYENVTLLENGSDVLAYDDEIASLIAKEFEAETGRFIPSHLLVAKLTALRKRGLLPKVGNRGKDKDDIGFNDIGKAVI